MKWILIVLWVSDGNGILAGQFGPFADKKSCESARASLRVEHQEGFSASRYRSTCALVSIDPSKLPAVETTKGRATE